MKKNFIKRTMCVAMTGTMVLGLTACGSSSKSDPFAAADTASTEAATQTADASATVDKLTIMMDGTVFTEPNGRAEFEKALEEVMTARQGSPVDIVFVQPDHSGYYDSVSQTFANPDTSAWPDVVLLGAQYYATYANKGVLTDISSYYNNSDFKARVKKQDLIDALYINDGLYAISPARGNGCITYVKQAWLDAAGITELPKTYEEYTAMLEAFKAISPDGYAVTSAGIVNKEAPFTNYLPEFFQDAYPDFTQLDDGTWVDGFTQDNMVEALDRLTEAYDEGWLDPEAITNDTKACREKFYSDKCGVFTYWAGTWAYTLESNLEGKSESDLPISFGNTGLVALPPIEEVGKYTERQATVWGITTACANPEKVFDLFFGSMLDGDAGQALWTYGVEGVHWSTEGGDLVLNKGTESEKTESFEDGTFHGLVNLETGGSLYVKNHIDKMLSIVDFNDASFGMEIDPRATASAEIFDANSQMAPIIISNDTMDKYSSEILAAKIELVTQVVTGEMSVEDAMAQYEAEYGDKVQEILDSLNN